MRPMFECPACGGLIEYPSEDELSGVNDYFEDDELFGDDELDDVDEFTVVCDWCRKRVEVPLEPAAATSTYNAVTPSIHMVDEKTLDDGYSSFWPRTRWGKIILGALLFVFIGPAVIFAIIAFIIGSHW